ncbi:MAG: YfiR family protein [Verrucomicrobiales bacterium]|nr:YfiR family protein [Verrucomicrobiales bacterium]
MHQVLIRLAPAPRRPLRSMSGCWLGLATWPILMVLAWSAALRAAEAPPGGVSEYQLKATFLVRFLDFVHWPASPNRDAARGVTIGVFGQDPFGSDLAKVIRDGRGSTRSIAWKHCRDLEEARQCQILFVSRRDPVEYKSIFAELNSAPVLTVGEGQEFTRLGGMIGMLSSDRRVQIEINTNKTSRAGLRIDPHLLQLARMVRDETVQGPEPP